MEKLIEFKKLYFAYDKDHAFEDFSMDINSKDIVTLIGTPASGKTTLLKLLCNRLPNEGLYYKGMKISSYDPKDLRFEIVVIFDEPTTEDKVKDEITKYVHKLQLTEDEIEKRLTDLNKYFPVKSMYDEKISELYEEQQDLIKILRYLIINPRFLAIDTLLTKLSTLDKRLFFEYIKKHEMTVLNVTTDLNDSLFGNKIYCLDNFTLFLEGSTFSVLKTDTVLKRHGFKLPLPVNLSIGLNNYDILQKYYKESDKLVNALWK